MGIENLPGSKKKKDHCQIFVACMSPCPPLILDSCNNLLCSAHPLVEDSIISFAPDFPYRQHAYMANDSVSGFADGRLLSAKFRNKSPSILV
jgi:hypothetical protein